MFCDDGLGIYAAEYIKQNFDIPPELEIVDGGGQACAWGMRFRSVIGVGRAEILEDAEEKRRGLECLMAQYSEECFVFPDDALARVCVVRVVIESISGKQSAR